MQPHALSLLTLLFAAGCAPARYPERSPPDPQLPWIERLIVIVDGVVQRLGPPDGIKTEASIPWMWSIDYDLEPGRHSWEVLATIHMPCSARRRDPSARFEMRDAGSFGVRDKHPIGFDLRIVESDAPPSAQDRFGLVVEMSGIVEHLPYEDEALEVPARCWIPEPHARHLCTAQSVLLQRQVSLETARRNRDQVRERCESDEVSKLSSALADMQVQRDPTADTGPYDRFIALVRASSCLSGGEPMPKKSTTVVGCPAEKR